MGTFTKIRERKGITQEEIARVTDNSKSNICAWEKGTRRIPPKHYDAIKKILGISEEELLQIVEESEFQGGKVKIGWMPNEKNAVEHYRSYLSFALKDEPLTDEERAKFRKILDKFDLDKIEQFRTK